MNGGKVLLEGEMARNTNALEKDCLGTKKLSEQ